MENEVTGLGTWHLLPPSSDFCMCARVCAPTRTLAHTHSLPHTHHGGIQCSLYRSLLPWCLGSDLSRSVAVKLLLSRAERTRCFHQASSHLDQIRGNLGREITLVSAEHSLNVFAQGHNSSLFPKRDCSTVPGSFPLSGYWEEFPIAKILN